MIFDPPLIQGVEDNLSFKSHHSRSPHQEGFEDHADKIWQTIDNNHHTNFSQGDTNTFGVLANLGDPKDSMDTQVHDTPQWIFILGMLED